MWGTRKTGLRPTVGLIERRICVSLAGSPGALPSPDKNGGDVVSRCLEGTFQTLLSRYSITFSNLNSSSTPSHQNTKFLWKNLDKLRDSYFQKVGICTPRPPLWLGISRVT